MRMCIYRLSRVAIGLSMASVLYAAGPEDLQGLEPLPDAPPPPARVQSGEILEPEVTIIQRGDATIEEYRINGNLYMIKVIPIIGRPYYLLDSDGDGQMETQMSDIYSDFVVPHWILFSW